MRDDAPGRLQQVGPSAAVLALAATVCWVSYTAEPSEAFLFPKLISTAMLALALIAFFNAVSGLAPPVPGISSQLLYNAAAGLAVMLVAVFWAAKSVGFYATALASFFVLASIYDPSGDRSLRSWLVRGAISIGFILVLYGLFALLLRVQTPRGWLM